MLEIKSIARLLSNSLLVASVCGLLVNVANSTEPEARSKPRVLTQFAEDVVLHVVLHEMGHALIREFDLPVLGNEETMADAFATCYLTANFPDRAKDVLSARVSSLMFEAREVPRSEWSVKGEHNSDARRAFQIAALAIAADPEKYASVAKLAEMNERDVRRAGDYGTEIHRSWRRIIAPIKMPSGMKSNEARVAFDNADNDLINELRESSLIKEIESTVRQFDWHSQVSVFFAEGDGGAGWNRGARRITINSAYVQRFIDQGKKLSATSK